MTAVLQTNHNAKGSVLYMALELSDKKWRLGFSNGDKQRQVTIEAGDWDDLNKENKARQGQAESSRELPDTELL